MKNEKAVGREGEIYAEVSSSRQEDLLDESEEEIVDEIDGAVKDEEDKVD